MESQPAMLSMRSWGLIPNLLPPAVSLSNPQQLQPFYSDQLPSLQASNQLPSLEERMEVPAPAWTLGTAYTCQLCGLVGWSPSTFPRFIPSGGLGPSPVLWPPENQPLHNLQGLQVGGVSHQFLIICEHSKFSDTADSTPSWFSTARFSSARSASPPSPGTPPLSQLTSPQHTNSLSRLIVWMSWVWKVFDQKYYKLHRPTVPRLKLPSGQKLLKNIDEVKAQAPECKSNIVYCQSEVSAHKICFWRRWNIWCFITSIS